MEQQDGELDAEYVWDTCFHGGEWMEPDIDLDTLQFLIGALQVPNVRDVSL